MSRLMERHLRQSLSTQRRLLVDLESSDHYAQTVYGRFEECSAQAAIGFNDAQIKSIQQTAKTAQHAATQVKTIGKVFDVAKETAGSGWATDFPDCIW
jgi:hypothetical protein